MSEINIDQAKLRTIRNDIQAGIARIEKEKHKFLKANDTITVRAWPDGSWMLEDDFDYMDEDYSDDYMEFNLPTHIYESDDDTVWQNYIHEKLNN